MIQVFLNRSKKYKPHRLYFCLGLAVVMLSGCVETTGGSGPALSIPIVTSETPKVKKVPSEALLKADGNWNIVEQDTSTDPTQAHLNARKKVNPKRRRKKADLAPHFEPDAASEKKFRVLKLSPQKGKSEKDLMEDVDVQDNAGKKTTVKPSHKIVSSDVLNKFKGLFKLEEKIKGYESIDETVMLPDAVAKTAAQKKPVFKKSDTKAGKKKEKSSSGFLSGVLDSITAEPEMENSAKSPKGDRSSVPIPSKKAAKKPIKAQPSGERLDQFQVRPKAKPDSSSSSSSQSVINSILKSTAKDNLDLEQTQKKTTTLAGIRQVTRVHTTTENGKTRLRLEVSAPVNFTANIERLRNVLQIELPKTKWGINAGSRLWKSDLLGSYITRTMSDGGTLLEIRLKEKTEITKVLSQPKGNATTRHIVIELDGN